jgi:hypothetical protein
MKLSEKTISILKNFSTVNPSIQFKPGKELGTISPIKTIMAKAKIDDVIENGFAIYDLSRFLGILSVFEKPEFMIGEKSMTIRSKNNCVKYTFADPSIVHVPPEKELDLGEYYIEFNLSNNDLQQIMKACGILSLPEIAVVGEDGKILLRAFESKNPTSDVYDIEIGKTDKNFVAVFRSENLKLIPEDYKVAISSMGISYFKNDYLEYWITLEGNQSNFE